MTMNAGQLLTKLPHKFQLSAVTSFHFWEDFSSTMNLNI
jgi:hypothetical protein